MVPGLERGGTAEALARALLFVVLACTDALDGYLARSRGEVTNFGKFMDPLADKILVAAALLALCELQILPSWVALIILTREFIVSGLRMLAASEGVVIAASWYGKAKTVFQIIANLLFSQGFRTVHLNTSDRDTTLCCFLDRHDRRARAHCYLDARLSGEMPLDPVLRSW